MRALFFYTNPNKHNYVTWQDNNTLLVLLSRISLVPLCLLVIRLRLATGCWHRCSEKFRNPQVFLLITAAVGWSSAATSTVYSLHRFIILNASLSERFQPCISQFSYLWLLLHLLLPLRQGIVARMLQFRSRRFVASCRVSLDESCTFALVGSNLIVFLFSFRRISRS
jgi:hypothetical protein